MNPPSSVINEICRDLAAMEVTPCRMTHECVQLDPHSNLPARGSRPDAEFVRNGLCPLAVRDRRIACGHTNARNRLRRHLRRLSTTDLGSTSAAAQNLSATLEDLDLKLCLLDHEKGFAEAEYARALAPAIRSADRDSAARALVECKTKVAELEQAHTRLVIELGHLRDRTLAMVDQLRRNHPTCQSRPAGAHPQS